MESSGSNKKFQAILFDDGISRILNSKREVSFVS
jgi:hypothetical protein